MVFPIEGATQLRRRILSICQDHIRIVADAVRELPLLFSSSEKGDNEVVLEHYDKIAKLEREAIEVKKRLIQELTQAGALLLSREDFFRLITLCSEISDYAGGIAYRMSEIAKRKWNAKQEILSDLTKLSDAVLDTVVNLRKTMYSLGYNVEKTREIAEDVESSENIVDSLFREIDLNIIGSGMDLRLIFVLRDVALLLEEIADKAEDAADVVRVLSLTAF